MTKAGEKLIAAVGEAVIAAGCDHDLVVVRTTSVSETYQCHKCGCRITQFVDEYK